MEETMSMTETTMSIEQAEETALDFEVSDEALEASAGTVRETAANYTLGACTGFSVCPA
jgi:hypothetical protein